MSGAVTSIGHYQVQGLLGTGRHGRTFDATASDGRRVALREIDCDPTAADRVSHDPSLRRLCAIIAGLSHDSLADTIEVFALGARVYVAEDFIESPTVADLLAQGGPLAPEEAWAIAGQVLAGLEFGHQRGLLHLDLRPINVYYERDQRRAILTDFGHMQLTLELSPKLSLASIADAHDAPEVRAGRQPTPASEVYSVGALMHEMLTARPPAASALEGPSAGRFSFLELGRDTGPASEDMLERIGQKYPGLLSVMRTALATDPADRYQRAALMHQALARAWRADTRGVA